MYSNHDLGAKIMCTAKVHEFSTGQLEMKEITRTACVLKLSDDWIIRLFNWLLLCVNKQSFSMTFLKLILLTLFFF